MYGNVVSDSEEFAKPLNVIKGATISADTFDTNPSNLPNAVDGKLDNPTGVGSKVMGGSGTVGNVIIDMGAVKTVLIYARMGMWTSASTLRTYIASSNDGITYASALFSSIWESTGVTSEYTSDFKPMIITGRYIKITFNAAAAATCNAKIYNIAGYEMGI